MFHYVVALCAAFVVYEVACQNGGSRNNGTGNSTINGTGGGNGTDGSDEVFIYYISADFVSGVLYEVVNALLGLIYALGGFGGGDAEEFGGNSTNSTNQTSPY
ncbi:hypothetical protein TELCIR_15024 [Teladorsagia circumcincta]|uniref:Uncharacterized protein n=1 Tax=Teladorsagia circumcincta TaxID=45464 RepID=A0A2G9TZD0_TELCI|nr:hypothetical protein TELCIR_15024 [Teladorsagia circumcincta]